MLHALKKANKLTFVYNTKVFIVRNETKHVKLKKFVGFRRSYEHNLDEMRTRMMQLHKIKPSEQKNEVNNLPNNNSEEIVACETSPFILDETEFEKVEGGDNKDFIQRLTKQGERKKNLRQTLFGFVRKDDDADRVITDEILDNKEKQKDESEGLKNSNDETSKMKSEKKVSIHTKSYKNYEPLKNIPENTQTTLQSGENAFDEEYFNLASVYNQSEVSPKNETPKQKQVPKGRLPIMLCLYKNATKTSNIVMNIIVLYSVMWNDTLSCIILYQSAFHFIIL